MDAVSLKLARNYTNEKLNSLPSNRPTKTVSFDGGIYSVGNDVVNGQISDVVIKGLTATNLVQNGNFDGTTKWSGSNATVSAVNNVLTVTGNGTASNPRTYQLMPVKANNKYYVVAKARVTNDVCTKLYSYFGGEGDKGISEILSPVQNQWYVLSGVVTTRDIAPDSLYIASMYSSAETANGKVMEVQEVMAIDMTAEGLEDLTADQMNAKFPHYFEGTKSTNSVRIKSVGKNLFDANKFSKTIYEAITTADIICPTISTHYIEKLDVNRFEIGNNGGADWRGASIVCFGLKPSTNYTISFNVDSFTVSGSMIVFRVSETNTATTLGTFSTIGEKNYTAQSQPNGKLVIRIQSNNSTAKAILSNIMIRDSYIADATFDNYKLSQSYINIGGEPLRSLPNGVKDEVRVTEGQKIQRIKEYILQASDITTMTISNLNVDYALVVKPTDSYTYNKYSNVGFALDGYSVLTKADATANIGTINGDGNLTLFFVGFAKGTTLTQAQTALAGKALIYQLAEPIVTKLPAQAPLQVFENGTVYVEPIGDASESTLPSVEMTIPTGTSNKFGVATHNYGGAAADWELTNSESKCFLLAVSNAGGAANIIAPDAPGVMYAISNASGYAITIKISDGIGGVEVVDSKTVLVIHNGTDYTALTAGL